MARLPHHRIACLIGAIVAGAMVCAATGCTALAEPDPSELIQREVQSVFDAVRGEEAVRAVLVHQRGTPVYEEYFASTAEDTWDVRSVTKSVVSTLVGIAIDRGLIDGVDAPLAALLPEYAALMTPELAAVPLRAVLTHTANFPRDDEPPLAGELDWVRAILEDRARRGPGDGSFVYSDAGSHILAAVVAEATGMSPLAFARQWLFGPLAIDTDPVWEERLGSETDLAALSQEYEEAAVAWPADPQGINLGATLLRVRPADLVRIGQLFLDEGEWEGQQVVSSGWVGAATAPSVATTEGSPDYGYQWWVDEVRGDFFALGLGGTAVVVDPQRDAVVVIASEIAIDDVRGTEGIATASALALAQALVDDLPETTDRDR